jgi:tetratricopeptide (TPR) repeat protein
MEQKAAQQHYQAGVMFFQAENWNAARAEFEAAYQLTKYPDLLYNLAKIAEKQGRTADEVRYLDEYLATNPRDSEAVRARLAVIRPTVPAAATTAPGTTSTGSSSLPWPAIGIAAGGVAFLIIGIACGGAAISAANTVASPTNTGKPFNADLFATQEQGKQLSSAAIAFDVLGGLALAAGGGWLGYWFYQRQQQKKLATPVKTALVPWGPGGPGVGLVGSF